MRRFDWAVGLALACAAAGCSRETHATLKGRVTLDGQPVKSGSIRFLPVNKDAPTASCMIVDGQYSAKVPLTTHRVVISSPRRLERGEAVGGGEPSDAATQTQVRETIPAKYNDATELTVEAKPGGAEVNFDLRNDSPEPAADEKDKKDGKKDGPADPGKDVGLEVAPDPRPSGRKADPTDSE